MGATSVWPEGTAATASRMTDNASCGSKTNSSGSSPPLSASRCTVVRASQAATNAEYESRTTLASADTIGLSYGQGGGGGFSGNGGGTGGGKAFLNGAAGSIYGGFGGGGHGGGDGGGGAGGYSGGAGGSGGGSPDGPGGGGGSYNAGSNQTNTSGANTGVGYVIIESL